MNKTICPGQDMRFWQPGDIFELPCNNCGKIIEFFKDDASQRCSNCGHRMQNPKISMGCAQWCEHAEKCLGYDPKAVLSESDDAETDISLSDKIINSIKDIFGEESKILETANIALHKTIEILKGDIADPRTVISAILLMNVDSKNSGLDKNKLISLKFDENKSLPVARAVLNDSGLDNPTIDDICELILSYHNGEDIDTPEYRIVSECYRLLNEKAIN